MQYPVSPSLSSCCLCAFVCLFSSSFPHSLLLRLKRFFPPTMQDISNLHHRLDDTNLWSCQNNSNNNSLSLSLPTILPATTYLFMYLSSFSLYIHQHIFISFIHHTSIFLLPDHSIHPITTPSSPIPSSPSSSLNTTDLDNNYAISSPFTNTLISF